MRAVAEQVIAVRRDEAPAAAWSFAYFFCVLASYYMLRPVREAFGAAAGVEGLPWLFTGTFLAMLAAVPVFGALAARFPRRTLLPVIYTFFIACILGLFALLRSGAAAPWAPAAFFIWLSVFNLFVVSVFWSFMADVWREEQARRLFGVIAAGGSAGALAGPAVTAYLAGRVGHVNLLPIAAAVLAGRSSASCGCAAGLPPLTLPSPPPGARVLRTPLPLGGEGRVRGEGGAAGWQRAGRDHGGVAVLIPPGHLRVRGAGHRARHLHLLPAGADRPRGLHGSGQRTAVFAAMDLAVNALTIGAQLFVTGRLAARFGLSRLLAFLPR